MQSAARILLWLLSFAIWRAHAAAPIREAGFTAMWWAEGPPHYLTMQGPAPAPLLCLRSGDLGFVVDTNSIQFAHAGRFRKTESKDRAQAVGTAALFELPPLSLKLSVVIAGRVYGCIGRGAEPKDEFFQPVQFVESGRFFQRVRIEGLEFADAAGAKLPLQGSLELALWPDRLSLAFEIAAPEKEVLQLSIAAGDRAATAASKRATLTLFEMRPENLPMVEGDAALRISRDPEFGCEVIHLPETPWSNAKGTYYPEEHLDRLDRWPIRLRNDSSRELTARLMFVQEQHLPITGFTPMLCDPDGAPSGLPVQISKNWHQRPEKGHLVHEGPWFHGFTFLHLPPKSERTFLFQMVYARYGGVPAASHAQLSLVGWGHNQFWDEAALGSFGESICYEPGRVQRRCFIDDIRPLMTLPLEGGKPWGWAGNCGGGDFLMWIDERGAYRGFRGTRTDYRSQGPCLTDVRYMEETSGGEIGARMEVSLARSDDYLRVFQRLHYEVRQPVSFSRVAFFQLGADYYNDTPAGKVAIGDAQGLHEEWSPLQARGAFDRRSIPLTGASPWVSIHGLDRDRLGKGSAAASRGFIVRGWSARLGGQKVQTPHLSTYASEWGRGNYKTVLELAPPAETRELRRGDFVDAEIEIVVFPSDAGTYYGPNQRFREALRNAPDSWKLVQREAAGNLLKVELRRGRLLQALPLVLAVDSKQRVDAEISGGVGWVPVTFTGLLAPRDYELRVNGAILQQALHGNDFWQTDYDAGSGKWRQTFNLPAANSNVFRIEFHPKPRR